MTISRSDMNQDIQQTEKYTVAVCDMDTDCEFSVSTNSLTRDEVKVAVHTHIRDTGHNVRFIDACTLSKKDIDALSRAALTPAPQPVDVAAMVSQTATDDTGKEAEGSPYELNP